MRLGKLLEGCNYVTNSSLNVGISGVSCDSQKVKDGYLFVAIKGERYDGHDFIKEAVKKGAIAIVHEKQISNKQLAVSNELTSECYQPIFIKVKNSRKALAHIANNFYGRPSESLTLIGVTGTNGKTTTTYILKTILESWGKDVGLIGTIRYMIKNRCFTASHTTPEPLEFQRLLRDMSLSGCTHVISEVSSHALKQFRVDGAKFKVAVFTNLGRDHLDFHKTMDEYFMAKKRLFKELLDKDAVAIINLDDPYGRKLNSELKTQNPRPKTLTYGINNEADMVANDIEDSLSGLNFKISFKGRNYNVSSPLIGLPNVYNIMAAATASIALGVPWEAVLEGISKTDIVLGRFERVDLGQKFLCIVDYAHTEDALERLIHSARRLLNKEPNAGSSCRVITVFGCGGDRDRGKRPRMGEVATRLSDFVIITSDNPRSEQPTDIIKDIEAGVVRGNYIVEPDRKEAIRKAVGMAGDGDIVLIAGKGHENYQEIGGIRYRFCDREVIEEALKERLLRHSSSQCKTT